jgi:carbon starvation protein CstA
MWPVIAALCIYTIAYRFYGHHFAAIAGAGPLVGPVLAAQMGKTAIEVGGVVVSHG